MTSKGLVGLGIAFVVAGGSGGGGAIFVRASRVTLTRGTFATNAAAGERGRRARVLRWAGPGKGGGTIFALARAAVTGTDLVVAGNTVAADDDVFGTVAAP